MPDTKEYIPEELTEDQQYLIDKINGVYNPESNVKLGDVVRTIDNFVEYKINKALNGKKTTIEGS